MNGLRVLAFASLACAVPSWADTAGTCATPFEAATATGSRLSLQIRSGDVEIRGADGDRIRVTCQLKDPSRAGEIRLRFAPSTDGGHLRASGGPNNGVKIRVEVPRQSHLRVRVKAGDVDVLGVTGDKDVEMMAGDLTVEVGNGSLYSHADASVHAGDLSADPFQVRKGGLFRSFSRDDPGGKYRLHTHLGAGDLTLKD